MWLFAMPLKFDLTSHNLNWIICLKRNFIKIVTQHCYIVTSIGNKMTKAAMWLANRIH